MRATIARQPYELTSEEVERALRSLDPEPIREHYVIVGGRRFPPKQVIAAVTGLDRSAFISTQARSVLERLGYTVGRLGTPPRPATAVDARSAADERLEREGNMLRPYIGQFVAVALDWTEVVASGPDPRAVSRALRTIGREGVIFQVPTDPTHDVGGFDW